MDAISVYIYIYIYIHMVPGARRLKDGPSARSKHALGRISRWIGSTKSMAAACCEIRVCLTGAAVCQCWVRNLVVLIIGMSTF